MVKINPKLLLEAIYPVGSIFINTTGTNPSTFLGGTWEEFGKGRVLVGKDTSQTEFDTLEETGGEKTHTLTVEEMPSHRHTVNYSSSPGTSVGVTAMGTKLSDSSAIVQATGGGQAHNNLQPYVVVSMWKRTA